MLWSVSSSTTVARKFLVNSETFGALRSLFSRRPAMKPSLRTLTEARTRNLRSAGARRGGLVRRRSSAPAASAEQPASAQPSGPADLALARTRAAGGPLDEACYSCECGYVFEASVSTTVTCPHCGASQAW